MAELIGFVTASQDETQTASNLFTIFSGSSPFQNGVKFTVSDFAFKKAQFFDFKTKEKSVSDRPRPVLTTSVGDLFIRSLGDAYDTNGNLHEADGDLNKFLRELRSNPDIKSDGDALKAIVDFCKGKTFVVRRSNAFKATSFSGREIQKALVNIDVAAE